MAVTECHISCTREEQLRWFRETWDSCIQLIEKGIDIQAVTAWSLLGAYDWNSLLTVEGRHYESGVFDIQGGSLRLTALAKQLQLLSTGGEYHHPLLGEKGWWNTGKQSKKQGMKKTPPILIIGKNGTLGGAFSRLCTQRSIPYIAVGRSELDICQPTQVQETIERYKPWAIINAAGYVRVDDAEANLQECFDINAKAPGIIAECCARHGIRFLTFSSDLVFDGEKRMPYEEADEIRPLNVYGASKANAESLIISNLAQALIIRTSAFFGPWDRYNFVYNVIKSFEEQKSLDVPADVVVSPTYVPDLVHTALDLFIDEEEGVWHLANEGRYTWADLAAEVTKRAGYNHCRIRPRPLIEMGWKAKRPLYSVLGTGKGIRMPAIDNALQRYFEQRAV
jgi:dTDP-4-dehydrorhamnose reductase